MNNGRPNYQQNPAGGQPVTPQQGGYVPQGYPQQQAPQGYPQQQAPQGYSPPQNQGYAPQGQMPQGYAPRQGQPMQQPQGGYQQPMYPGQQGANRGYQQPQQGYYQGQPMQQPPQGYSQQPYQQNYGMPGYPGPNGYQNMYQQPAPAPQPKKPFPVELAVKIALFGVLPLLFVLGVVLANTVLKWMFIVLAAAGVAFLWVKPVLPANTRLTLTTVYAAAAIVALVSALTAPPADTRNQHASNGQPASAATNDLFGDVAGQAQASADPAPQMVEVVTATPEPSLDDDAAVAQLKSFFYFWQVNNYDNMLSLCAPSWKNSVSDPSTALFAILANRRPVEYEVETISGNASDSTRTATVKASIDRRTGKDPTTYRLDVIMLKEDEQWYVAPKSLTSAEPTDEPTATPTAEPTATPTVSADTVLYYNPDGGSMYHLSANCSSVSAKYKPLKGSFKYSELNDSKYAKLTRCSDCNAPVRPTK